MLSATERMLLTIKKFKIAAGFWHVPKLTDFKFDENMKFGDTGYNRIKLLVT